MAVLPFDERGALIAFAFFLFLLLILAGALALGLRRERGGLFRMSRRMRIAGATVLSLVYLAVLYGWLFLSTFYELRVLPQNERLEVVLRMPTRQVSLPLSEIASIRRTPAGRAGLARVVVEARDGRNWRSPDLGREEARETVGRLQRILPGEEELFSSRTR